ncbi:MAG: hypothetical protein C0410_03015 [Anaerolinea sp.]|nr:hypothetical protein [Anaerolinea sp.]
MFPRKIRDEVVYVASGMLEAESIKIMLESFGITAFVNQESAGTTYGLTVGFLGDVEVIVPLDQVSEAKKIIADMEAGNLEDDSEILE